MTSRLERVRHELVTQGGKLSFLARKWGLYDRSYLIKRYRQYFGHRPGQDQREA